MKGDQLYLDHIRDAIGMIETYTLGKTRKEFMQTPMMRDAVIRQLEIVGEATKKISRATRKKHPSVPWKDMAGMRDKLIHEYFGVDLGAVWDTATKDLPVLKKQILEITGRSLYEESEK
jgi:uncharacterized protein with HEPN domain